MSSRLFWFLVGCAIGIVIGYIVRSLREIRDKVDEVDRTLKNDRGLIRYPLVMDVVLLVVVVMTFYAAITSQIASNKSDKQSDKLATQQSALTTQQNALAAEQRREDKLVACNNTFLQGTIAALNARTVFTVAQAKANVDLQVAFNKVVTASLAQPPPDDTTARKIVEDYAKALAHFISLSSKTSTQVESNPYPTPKAFLDCLTNK